MTHYMNLHRQPFNMIKAGFKTIELRLFDEKRQQIKECDTIVFFNSDNAADQIAVQVKALHVFSSFEKLYEVLPLDKCGYTADEIASASPADMDTYYSKEKQSKYGVVGIEIELLTEGQI